MPTPTATNARRELIAIAVLTLLGAVLRFWGFARLGLEHFDEGIYALAGLWPFGPRGLAGLNPEVIPYAPPGFPILVGMAYMVFGVADLSAIVVSLVAGVLTVPVAAWLGRRTFGPGAGVATAAFAALSGPHVAFSRMALTDATFLLAWLVALGLGMRFLERPRLGRALAFGMAVGLAQNVKYNGGLTGIIVALASLVMLVKPEPGCRREVIRVLGYGLIAAVVSVLMYLPWYRFVEAHGSGYAGLMAHHRGYLGGVRQWLPHWRTQMAEQVALAGVLTWGLSWGAVAWPMAWVGCRLVVGGGPPSRWNGMRFRLGLLGGTVALGASASLPWWVTLARCPALLVQGRPAARVVAVGWVLMAVLTPFYHPYARLWLPLHAFGWLILGGLVVELGKTQAEHTDGPEPIPPAPRRRVRAGSLALLLAVAASFGLDRGGSPHPEPMAGLLGPSDSLRTACQQVAKVVRGQSPVEPIRVLARPPVLFYLSMDGLPIERVESADALYRPAGPRDWALHDSVIEPVAPRSRLADQWRIRRWLTQRVLWDELTPPTFLDLDPGAAFHPSGLAPTSTRLIISIYTHGQQIP